MISVLCQCFNRWDMRFSHKTSSYFTIFIIILNWITHNFILMIPSFAIVTYKFRCPFHIGKSDLSSHWNPFQCSAEAGSIPVAVLVLDPMPSLIRSLINTVIPWATRLLNAWFVLDVYGYVTEHSHWSNCQRCEANYLISTGSDDMTVLFLQAYSLVQNIKDYNYTSCCLLTHQEYRMV